MFQGVTTDTKGQHAAPPGLMRDGDDMSPFLRTCRSSGARMLPHCMTELRCEKPKGRG